MRMFLWIVLFLGWMTQPVLAEKKLFSKLCATIHKCANTVSKITGEKYLMDLNVKGRMKATDNIQLTKSNAILLFTKMLNTNGFSRVPTGEKDTFSIERQRTARDLNLPIFKGSKKNRPNFPKNYDLITFQYKVVHPEYTQIVGYLARHLRSFMPANGRVIPSELNGVLTLTDTAMNMQKLYQLIIEMDVKPTAALLKRWEKSKKMWQKKHNAKWEKSKKKWLNKQKKQGR